MNILLTGAYGFIGRALCMRLVSQGHTIHALTRKSRPQPCSSWHCWQGDLSKCELPKDLPWHEIDRVVHLAASGVKSSNRNWDDALKVNILGTSALLNKIEQHAARQPPLLIARTFYEGFLDQNVELFHNPYIATKWTCSKLIEQWELRAKWNVSYAHIFQVYGPGDDPVNVISYAIDRFARNQKAEFGSGRSLRDWLFIDDAVDALAAIVNRAEQGSFDIGSGELQSIRFMIELAAKLCNASADLLDFDPSRDRESVATDAKACKLPRDWRPKVSHADGLKSMVEWAHRNKT